ncbi:NADH dehydrogenase [ubiquinone] 1 alpha subcomplex assembly factor 2 isoform X2 [Chiloscyllium plagiosum]|uniref:NADH dehydrogenase [ubiquinone] 1 alpha subcomplex assembly factor 2 isoform X2 n=1 Tax=Chiloscyllium plagiosum TaxID=36176 RepID=UPI001CB8890E|nr:NADH dehydrogenase [ubiquinone] 1 alpha subcomplex assembly factor 2 isoform X2 [Chiloscyllium plagiosum]
MSQIRTLLQRMFGLVKHHVGTDQFGNKYYYIPEQRSWTAWIRGRRVDPPTIEEILRNEEYRKMIKINADEVQQKEEIRREKEYEEGLVARPIRTQTKGHASATYYGKDDLSSEPSSTANTFQPGGWLPPENSNKKK